MFDTSKKGEFFLLLDELSIYFQEAEAKDIQRDLQELETVDTELWKKFPWSSVDMDYKTIGANHNDITKLPNSAKNIEALKSTTNRILQGEKASIRKREMLLLRIYGI